MLKKMLIRGGIVVGFMLLLLATFVLSLPHIVPTNRIRLTLIRDVESHSGFKLSLENLAFFLLPEPRFVIRNIRLTHLGTPILGAQTLTAHFSALDALRSQRFLLDVTVDGLQGDGAALVSNLVSAAATFFPTEPKRSVSYLVQSVDVESGNLAVPWWGGLATIEGLSVQIADLPNLMLNGAQLRLSGKLSEANAPVNAAGVIRFDQQTRELRADQWTVSLGEVNASVIGSVDPMTTPTTIMAEIAAAELEPQQLKPLVPFGVETLPGGIVWSGPVNATVRFEQGADGNVVRGKVDALSAAISKSPFFIKSPNLPLSATFAVRVEPHHIFIDSLQFDMGQEPMPLKGAVNRLEGLFAKLSLESTTCDLASIKPYLPFLTMMDDLINAHLALEFEGALTNAATPPKVIGKFSATQAVMANTVIDDVELHLQYDGTALTVPVFKGRLYDGALSGTGQIVFAGDMPEYRMNLVVEGVNAAYVPTALPLSGRGSLVAQVETKGTTPEELLANLTTSGTFLLPQGVLDHPGMANTLLEHPRWTFLTGSTPLRPQVVKALSFPMDLADLKVSFSRRPGKWQVESATFAHANFNGTLAFEASDGEISGSGSLHFSPALSSHVFADAKQLASLTNQTRRVQLPFLLRGTRENPTLSLDQDAFAQVFQLPAAPVDTAAEATVPVTEIAAAPAALPTSPETASAATTAPPPSTETVVATPPASPTAVAATTEAPPPSTGEVAAIPALPSAPPPQAQAVPPQPATPPIATAPVAVSPVSASTPTVVIPPAPPKTVAPVETAATQPPAAQPPAQQSPVQQTPAASPTPSPKPTVAVKAPSRKSQARQPRPKPKAKAASRPQTTAESTKPPASSPEDLLQVRIEE